MQQGVHNVIDTGSRPAKTQEVEMAVAAMAEAEEATAKLGSMYSGSSSHAAAASSGMLRASASISVSPSSRLGKMSQQSKLGYMYDTLRIWNMEMESGWR
ncbi:hypothetical protein Vafri_6448, partial [Volvox africanus]